MTLNDLLKRLDISKDKDKVIELVDHRGGWCNVKLMYVSKDTIFLEEDLENPFSDEW